MEKINVLDTNVIIEDPNIINKLEGDVCIPTTVLKELDKKKYTEGTIGYHVREFSRLIDIKPKNIFFFDSEGFVGSNDDKIIMTAVELSKDHSVILFSNDLLMGALAVAKGIDVKKHELLLDKNQSYTGVIYEGECEYLNQYSVTKSGIHRFTNSGYKRLGKDKKVWGISHRNAEQKCVLTLYLMILSNW